MATKTAKELQAAKRQKELRKKWQKRTEDNRPHSSKVHIPLFDTLFAESAPTDPTGTTVPPHAPDTLRCSFCGHTVDPTQATFGKKPRTVYSKKLVTNEETGEIDIEEIKLHRQDKIISCPRCVLNIKPTVSRDVCPNCEGKKIVVRNGVEFGCLRCAKPNKQGILRPTGRVDGSVRTNLYIVSREEL